jgi:type I restriction enzyme S subunit
MKHIRKSALEKITMIVPTTRLLSAFEAIVSPMLGQISILHRHNTGAIKARDLLLPRLMNGEVSV